MVSKFYQSYSKPVLWVVALSFPFLAYVAESIPSNNDIETWLPKDAAVRVTYEKFKHDFGIEEVIVIGIDSQAADERLIEALATRIKRLHGIRECWTPRRLQAVMQQMGVSEQESLERLKGLVISRDGTMLGMVALLADAGLKDRAATVADVRRELEYCQLSGKQACLTGAPVIVTELDRLGSQKSNRHFFVLTLLISLGLLHYTIGHWGMALSILGMTIWGINLTQTIICLCGGEMNFILGALPIMVMIFTLSITIHTLSYYTAATESKLADPLGSALAHAAKPCFLATLTTLIGVASLTVSTILPVSQFGYAAGLGSVVAILVGLGLTPALLTLWPNCGLRASRRDREFERLGNWIGRRSRWVVGATAGMMLVACFGLSRLKSDIDPVEFLPRNAKVLSDLRRVERELTNIDSIEAVVDFAGQPLPFLEKLEQVRHWEARIKEHPAIRHTMSLASFFPTEMPESPLGVMRILKQAQSNSGDCEYLAEGDRLWRISARVNLLDGMTSKQVFDDLTAATAGAPIHFTGITPLLEQAQMDIFKGFWESFGSAFLIISVVMVVSLWSLKAGLVAMVPNLAPLWIIFGIVGFLGMSVDIGMMMSGSIAIGIAVDGTFHFYMRYQEFFNQGYSSTEAAQRALQKTGEPILDSAIVGSIGMLALGLSNFAPTARFGYLMTSLLVAALLGDVILLPALLCLRPTRGEQNSQVPPAETAANAPMPHHRPAKVAERVA